MTSSDASKPGSVDLIHIHEDDWGQRHLYPEIAWADVEAEGRALDAHADKYADPNGYGFSEIYAIKGPTKSYKDVGLKLEPLATELGKLFPRVKNFNATISGSIGKAEKDPFGSYETDAWCFGVDWDCFIKLETDGQLISDIWYAYGNEDQELIKKLIEAIRLVHQHSPSVVSDYAAHGFGKLSDAEFAEDYFEFVLEESLLD